MRHLFDRKSANLSMENTTDPRPTDDISSWSSYSPGALMLMIQNRDKGIEGFHDKESDEGSKGEGDAERG